MLLGNDSTGGNLNSTGVLQIQAGQNAVGLSFAMTRSSAVTADATGYGAWSEAAASTDARISIQGDGDINLKGNVSAADAGADLSILSRSQVWVDGLVHADDTLSITGGTDVTKFGVLIDTMVVDADKKYVSGGTLDTAAGGTINITSTDAVLVQGVVGQVVIDPAAIGPLTLGQGKVGLLTIQSTGSDVVVLRNINARDHVVLLGGKISVLSGSVVYATGVNSDVFIQARSQLLVSGADNTPGEELDDALIMADGLVHLAAPKIDVNGVIRVGIDTVGAANGRLLVNAGSTLSLSGLLVSDGTIELNAGVDMASGRAAMEAAIARSQLLNGGITIHGQAVLQAAGAITVQAGGDVTIDADAAVSGTRTVSVTSYTTEAHTVQVVSGYEQVVVGTVEVPVVTYVPTEITEHTGDALVKVGSSHHEMKVTLSQTGYYNPNAPAGQQYREYLIEGVDYFNQYTDLNGDGKADGIVVDWTNAGTAETGAVSTEAAGISYGQITKAAQLTAYKGFGSLSAAQKQAVLNATGYMALFEFSYTNPLTYTTRDGVKQDPVAWTPSWSKDGTPQVVYHIALAGWTDKYILMPKGAQEDLLSVVSDGAAALYYSDTTDNGVNDGIWVPAVQMVDGQTVRPVGELVGHYTDTATVSYNQSQSNYYMGTDGYPVVSGQNNPHNGVEDGRASWTVGYDAGTGVRTFDLAGRASATGNSTISAYALSAAPVWTITDGNSADDPKSQYYARDEELAFNVDDNPDKPYRHANIQADALVNFKNGRYTDVIYATGDYVAVLGADTATLTPLGSSTHVNPQAFSYKYWTNWTTLVGHWVDNDDGSGWGDYDDEDEIPEWGQKERDGSGVDIWAGGQERNTDKIGTLYLVAGGNDAYDFWAPDVFNGGTFANWKNIYQQIRAINDYTSGDEANGGGGDDLWIQVQGRQEKTAYVSQNYTDYDYKWTSDRHAVYDSRVQMSYTVKTNATDINELRPVYTTSVQNVAQVTMQTVNVWETRAITQSQTVLTTVANTHDVTFGSADFHGETLKGSSISISAGGAVDISGKLSAAGTLNVSAGTLLQVQSNSSDTVPFLSVLSGATINLHADQSLTLGDTARLVATDDSSITLDADRDLNVGGAIGAASGARLMHVDLNAERNIALRGSISAELITLEAGSGNSGDGGIHADAHTTLTASGGQADIRMSTGIYGGNIVLDHALLSATDTVELNAVAGSIQQLSDTAKLNVSSVDTLTQLAVRHDIDVATDQSAIKAGTLLAHAENAVALNLHVDSVTVGTTGSGNIDLTSHSDLTLTSVVAADGAVSVVAFGNVLASAVETQGTSDRNDINIATYSLGTADAKLTLDSLKTGGRGDIVLTAQGAVSQQNGGLLQSDELVVSGSGAMALLANVNSLTLTSSGAGDVTIAQGSRNLVLNKVSVANGSFKLTAGGGVDIADLRLASNLVGNDIDVKAAGDILVRYASAGVYLDDGAVPAVGSPLAGSGQLGSAGNITLTSTGGQIAETYGDDAVDLVGARLTLVAVSGITGLEIAANELDARTTGGNIELSEFDGQREKTAGLSIINAVTSVMAGGSSVVSITTEGELRAGKVTLSGGGTGGADARIAGDTVRLISSTADLLVSARSDGAETVDFTRGVVFNAAHVIHLYKFIGVSSAPGFKVPELIEYRAGEYFLFGPDITGQTTKLLPSAISADTLILETGGTLTLDGSLSANTRLELVAGEDVNISGTISVKASRYDGSAATTIDKLVALAKGVGLGRATDSTLAADQIWQAVDYNGDGNYTTLVEDGQHDYNGDGDKTDTLDERKASRRTVGNLNIQTNALPASNFELRARHDINVTLGSALTLTGFVGGVSGYEYAGNVTLDIAGQLTVQGGIVAANASTGQLNLTATAISTDRASVFIAYNLNVLAQNGIQLNTLVSHLSASSTVKGNISINEADTLTIDSVLAREGRIDIFAGDTLHVRDVRNLVDGYDIVVKSAGDLYVDYIEAAVLQGAQKTAGSVTLDAAGKILEWETALRGSDGVLTGEVAYDQTTADVYGYKVTLLGDSSSAGAPVKMTDASKSGNGAELEVRFLFTDTSHDGLYLGATTVSLSKARADAGATFSADVATPVKSGTSVKQIDRITFGDNLGADYSYSVTLQGVTYTVRAGDVVNGATVTPTWASILAALDFKLESANDVIVDVNSATRTLTLTARDFNEAFTLGAVGVVQHVTADVLNGVYDNGSSVTQAAGTETRQTSVVQFGSAALADDTDYTVVINGHAYTVQTGTNVYLSLLNSGSAAVTLEVDSPIAGAAAATVSAAGATSGADRTVDISGTTVTVGGSYIITVAGVEFTYVAAGGDTLSQIASGLAAKINASASYAASVDAAAPNVVKITSGAGTAAISVAAYAPQAGAYNLSISSTTRAGLTLNLSDLPVTNSARYTVTVGATRFVYTADNTATLAEISAGLVAKLDADPTYAASYTSVTVNKVWASVMTALGDRIAAGENISIGSDTEDGPLRKLTLNAQTVNTPFTVNAVGVTLAAAVTADGSEPQVVAASGVKQQSVVDFDSVTFGAGTIMTVMVNGKVYSVSTADRVTTAASGDTPASTAVVNKTWSAVLAELATAIEAGGAVTVTIDDSAHSLTLLGKTDGTAFTVDAALVVAKADVVQNGSVPTTAAGVYRPQVSDIRFDSFTLQNGHSFTVTVGSATYVVTVGQDGVTADWSSVYAAFKADIEADGAVVVSGAGNATRDLVLTGKVNNTPFSVANVGVTYASDVTLANPASITHVATAGASATQQSTLTFNDAVKSSVTYTVNLGASYSVKVGDNVAGYGAVTASWNSVLGALAYLINDADAAAVTAAVGASGAQLTLTAKFKDTPFSVSASGDDASTDLPQSGDYVLIVPERGTGSFSTSATGSLTVVTLPTHDNESISLRADKALVVVSALDVGNTGGTVTLTAGTTMTLGGQVTATTLNVTAGGDLTLTSLVNSLHAVVHGQGSDLTVLQRESLGAGAILNISSITMDDDGNGNINLVVYDSINIGEIAGLVGNITITSLHGDITIGKIGSAAHVTLSALNGKVMAGTGAASSIEADTLDIVALGAISIYEKDALLISRIDSISDATVTVTAGGALTVDGAITATLGNTVSLTSGGALLLNQSITTASGAITLDAAGAMTLTGQADLTSVSGTLTLNAHNGALTMTGDTLLDAGAGLIRLDAGGDITLGKLHTTNTGELTITTGGKLAVTDGETDIVAAGAKLVINAHSGVASATLADGGTAAGQALRIQVAELRIINLVSGEVAVEEVDGLLLSHIEQHGSGAVSLATLNGALHVTGQGVTAGSGKVTLYAGGIGGTIALDADIATSGSVAGSTSVALTAEDGDIVLAGGVHVSGNGDIVVRTPKGGLLNSRTAVTDPDGTVRVAGWLTVADGSDAGTERDFDSEISWAMSQGMFVVDQATGAITVANVPAYIGSAHIGNGTVLRSANGAMLQTGGGNITIMARDEIGELADGFLFSPLSIVVDAVKLTASSSERLDVAILATVTIDVVKDATKDNGSGSKGGSTAVVSLTGTQVLSAPLDASGKDVTIRGNDVSIDGTIRSAGAVLSFVPLDPGSVIVLGNGNTSVAGMHIDNAELAKLQDGFSRIVVGSDVGHHTIYIGNTGATSSVNFSDTLYLRNPVLGGEIFFNSASTVSGSLLIDGSGHTTTYSAALTATDDINVNDSVEINGSAITLTAGSDGSGDMALGLNTQHTLKGNGDGVADKLILNAPGNISIGGAVGASTLAAGGLAGLTIGGVNVGGTINTPDNVTFNDTVTLNGDLIINASGIVTFTKAVTLTNGGDLSIFGATQVIFQGGVILAGGGDLLVEADEITFAGGGESVIGTGTVTLRPTTLGLSIEVGSPPNSVTADTLNIDNNELATFADGFSKIIIGHQSNGHATAGAGAVRIGAIGAVEQPTLRDNLEVYGGNISVADYNSVTQNYTLLVYGSIKLDAVNDITIQNQVEARNNGVLADLTLYSASGAITQSDATGDGISGEALRGAHLDARAALGISLLYTELSSVSAQNTGASGDIVIHETAVGGDLQVTALNQAGAGGSGDITLQTAAGHITVLSSGSGVVTSGSGDITLAAGGSARQLLINDVVTSTAGSITLSATGVLSNSAGPITSSGGSIALTSSAANVALAADISSAGGLVTVQANGSIGMADGTRITSLNAGDTGVVNLVAGTSITLSIIEADGAMLLNAQNGAISDVLTGNGANLDGETAQVTLRATAGIGAAGAALYTRIDALSAFNTVSGGLFIQEATALRLTATGVFAVDLGGSGGTLSISTTDGALTVVNAVRSTGASGNLLLRSGETLESTQANLNMRADITSSFGSISLAAADSLVIDDLAGGTPRLSTLKVGQTLDLRADDAVTMEGAAQLVSNNGNIRLESVTGSITVGIINAGTSGAGGSISIKAGADIVDAQADDLAATPTVNLLAAGLRLQAGGSIGAAGAALETQVATLAATGATGGTWLNEKDALSVGTVGALAINRIDAAGTVATVSDAALSGLGSTGAASIVLASGGNLSIDQVVGATGSGHILLSSGGTLALNSTAGNGSGSITLLATGAISQSAMGHLVTGGGTIDVESSTGGIVMASGAMASTNGASIRYKAAGDITLGLLDARTAANRGDGLLTGQAVWGTVSVLAAGSVLDIAGDSAVDIYAGELRLAAGTSIGPSARRSISK